MQFAVGARSSARFVWHEIDAHVALRVMRNIFITRMGNSQLKKACARNFKRGGDWDIRTHPEAVPPNGATGTAKDGMHTVAGFDDLK